MWQPRSLGGGGGGVGGMGLEANRGVGNVASRQKNRRIKTRNSLTAMPDDTSIRKRTNRNEYMLP